MEVDGKLSMGMPPHVPTVHYRARCLGKRIIRKFCSEREGFCVGSGRGKKILESGLPKGEGYSARGESGGYVGDYSVVCKVNAQKEGRGSVGVHLGEVSLAEASEEEKWLQPANPEAHLCTEPQTDREHNRIAYCLLHLYRQAEA